MEISQAVALFLHEIFLKFFIFFSEFQAILHYVLYKTDSINRKEVFMQQQKRVKLATCMKWKSLLFCLVLFGITGCQQPTKPLVREIKTDKSVQKPAKPSNGNSGNSGNSQSNEQEEFTYKGLDIPKTLARSPQRLREMIFQGRQISETEPQLNAQGMVVKYIEKEVEHDISRFRSAWR